MYTPWKRSLLKSLIWSWPSLISLWMMMKKWVMSPISKFLEMLVVNSKLDWFIGLRSLQEPKLIWDNICRCYLNFWGTSLLKKKFGVSSLNSLFPKKSAKNSNMPKTNCKSSQTTTVFTKNSTSSKSPFLLRENGGSNHPNSWLHSLWTD